MNKFDVFVEIEDKRWLKSIDDLEKVVEACKTAVLDVVKKDVVFLRKKKNFSVNLNLSNDETIRSLNKQFRNTDKPTNVLSFANVDDELFDEMLESQTDIELGDVIIAYETMREQAQDIGISFYAHFCHLWVHGLLHILGYDHIDETERAQMEAKEIDILHTLHIENPYQE